MPTQRFAGVDATRAGTGMGYMPRSWEQDDAAAIAKKTSPEARAEARRSTRVKSAIEREETATRSGRVSVDSTVEGTE
jgi:hypothetical protein